MVVLTKDLEQKNLGLATNPALIVVDMINGFTDPKCPLGSHCQEVVAANCELLAIFRAKGLPVFFTTVVYHDDQQATVFRAKVPALNLLQPGSHWVAVDPKMRRADSEPLIEKQWASAFHKTDLDDQLKALGVDSLVITGLTTSGCVRASAVDGLQNNYQVVVAKEAVGDRNPAAHEASLFDLGAKYTDVQSIREIESFILAL
ncbi:MAG: isochorismatase family protein [Porticoccaceae bacterium]|mgnify:FL=1|nr:isochorismatase family protein [Porticoccaceae bacterium]MBT4165219.1 isochorismatase family protein [Porticoccaceae bacterium]MBT4591008.1 isochorismatase family protein [Porticoccaceae bacterium]MBT5103546.1 isochorismatase family protein [Porticoccaceae bacterium]MBT6421833.1 isochorismatase family protein [Porticoccaceae bacterium]